MVKIGSPAPNFHLEGFSKGHFKKYELKDFKGKWLVVFFYPLDFTFVCPTEIREFSARYPEFKKLNAEVLGVSVDSVHSHKAWVEGSLGAINFPLLSDFHKKMARDYEVLLEDEGVALRATLLIDPYGKVQYARLWRSRRESCALRNGNRDKKLSNAARGTSRPRHPLRARQLAAAYARCRHLRFWRPRAPALF